jgi:hypothetical protein
VLAENQNIEYLARMRRNPIDVFASLKSPCPGIARARFCMAVADRAEVGSASPHYSFPRFPPSRSFQGVERAEKIFPQKSA